MAATGTKTLAQLEEEGKEKKYVTLETGAKISGYTKEYLERLCRLNQVDYRVWNNGQLVIELESLLDATKAILLSYDGISFVDRNELMDPTPQIVGKVLADTFAEVSGSRPSIAPGDTKPLTQPIPTFLNANRIPSAGDDPHGQVSVIGRPVNANRELFGDEQEVHIAVTDVGENTASVSIVPQSSAPRLHGESGGAKQMSRPPLPPSPYRSIVTSVDASVHHDPAPLFPPVGKKEQHVGPVVVLPKVGAEQNTPIDHPHSVPVHLAIAKEERPPLVRPASVGVPSHEIHVADEWDRLLLHGGAEAAASQAIPRSAVNHDPEAPGVHAIAADGHSSDTSGSSSSDAPAVSIPPMPQPESHAMSSAVFPDRHHVLPTKKYPAIPVLMPVPLAPARIVRGTEHAPALRVMPDHSALAAGRTVPESQKPVASVSAPHNLPAASPEHHLALLEPHPLMKSTGFNAVFLLLVGGVLTLLLGGVAADRIRSFVAGSPEEYVAAAALPGLTFSTGVAAEENMGTEGTTSTLPFSDPVIAVESDDGTTLFVQPLFPDGAGAVEEFPLR